MIDRKEIELLVRAQLKGGNDLAAVTKAIGELERAVDKQAKAAERGEGSIDGLKTSLEQLKQVQHSLESQADLIGSFQKLSARIAETEQRVAKAGKAYEDYKAKLSASATVTDKQQDRLIKLSAAYERATGTLARYRLQHEKAAAALKEAGIKTESLAQAEFKLRESAAAVGAAMEKTRGSIERATTAQSHFVSGDTAAALGRIKSQVLGLASAYIGVQQAAGLAGDSIRATSTREGLRNQLALSVGNDREAIDAEYEYVRGQADRIGIEFERALKGYAKFSAAAKLAGRDSQEIRSIWESFAEVGRVANLTADDLDGVFKALEQITSKGSIQAEELRGQLGDRLFGAFQVAAEALKDQFPDLDAAMKQGQVSGSQLVLIAEKYREIVADQLPAATQSLAAQQARLNNVVLDFKLAIADAGWADAFVQAIEQITHALRSDDGKKLAEALSAGFSAAADAVVWMLQNLDEVTTVLKALSGLVAISFAGKAVKGLTDYAGGLQTLAANASVAVKELGLVRGVIAALQAAFVGWSIGTWAREEFTEVRQAGVALVTGLDMAWTRIRAGAEILFEEIPQYAKNGFAGVLNAVTFTLRKILGLMADGFRALGNESAARGLQTMVDGLTATYEQQGTRVAEIRAQMEKDIQRIRDLGFELFQDAGRRPSAPSASPTASPTPSPVVTPTRSTTSGGGQEARDAAKKVNEEILKDRRQLQAQLDDIDAAAGRKSKTDLDARLEAITLSYRDTYQEIADFRAKLESAGLSTGEADAAKERLDTAVAELKQLELARFKKDELKRLEGEINALLSTRADLLRAIADKEGAQLLTGEQARDQARQAIDAIQPQIDALADQGITFAESLRGGFNPLILDAFIARLELARGSGERLGNTLADTQKTIESMLADRGLQAFEALGTGIGDAIAGQKSWTAAIQDTGKAFLQFAAGFLRQLALMIARAQILKAIENSTAGSGIAGAVTAAVKHSGGIVGGTQTRQRNVSPLVFHRAPRYHSGGIAGLGPDEYATILKRNEEVLTADSPRNILNGGGLGQKSDSGAGTRFVLVDDRSRVSEAMATAEGEKVVLVHLRNNIPTLKQLLK